METNLEKEVRFLKRYTVGATILGLIFIVSAFTMQDGKRSFEEITALVTLSDPDGKPRLRLKVDKLGQASTTFLDRSGKIVRTIKP